MEENTVFFKDFQQMCRICLVKQNLQTFPQNLFAFYVNLVINGAAQNEDLPQNICLQCTLKLEDMHSFIDKCKNQEILLNNILENRLKTKTGSDLDTSDIDTVVEPNIINKQKSKGTSEKRYKSKVKMKVMSSYECNICNKIYYGKASFANHCRMHKNKTEPRTFLCSYCGKHFMKNSHLERHIRSHTGIKPFKCDKCEKCFGQGNDLKRHLLTHTREKIFQCMQCNKGFHQKSCLANHIMTHSNERNHFCNFCDKTFTLKTYLNIHMRIHTGQKLFQCPHCDKQFPQKGGLNNHILTHTGEKPFKCTQCEKAFVQSNHLKEHERIHSGEKPYICSFCGKTFAYTSTLKVHLRQHTGETPHICSYCGKGFRDASNLRRHVTRHHSGGNTAAKDILKIVETKNISQY